MLTYIIEHHQIFELIWFRFVKKPISTRVLVRFNIRNGEKYHTSSVYHRTCIICYICTICNLFYSVANILQINICKKKKNYIYINSNDIKSFTLCEILFLTTFMGLTSVDYSLFKIKFRYLYILIQSVLNNQLIVLKR